MIYLSVFLWMIALVFGAIMDFPQNHMNVGLIILNVWLAAAMVKK